MKQPKQVLETSNDIIPRKANFVPSIMLCGLNTPVCIQLLVNKPEFSLGKSPDCDGVLSFNNEISRLHCCILWNNGQYEVVDCGSTNYTYLNSNVLEPETRYLLQDGDELRLSTSTFRVERIYTVPSEVN